MRGYGSSRDHWATASARRLRSRRARSSRAAVPLLSW
jgi:hypothetical protein